MPVNVSSHITRAEAESIQVNIRNLRSLLPAGVDLAAVSKFHPAEAVLAAYNAGQRIFGESRVQELLEKIPLLPADIRWHFIGHLQSNKVRMAIGKCALIESVDSRKILDAIDRESAKAGVVTNVLFEVHIAREETKSGFEPAEIIDYFKNREFENLKATHICGIMGMASNTEDNVRIASDFARIASVFNRIKEIAPDLRSFDRLSMGMSHDWPLAVEEGANIVRIGTAIFGQRSY